MPLTQVGVAASLTWELQKPVTGFSNVVHGPESASFALNSLSVATWTEVFAAQYTIASSGTQAVDLRSFTDLAGTSVTATKALSVIITVTGAVADVLNVKKHGTNGLLWFFENATYGVNIPGGGMLAFSEGSSSTGTTVDATNRQLLLTNTGSADLVVKIVVILGTA